MAPPNLTDKDLEQIIASQLRAIRHRVPRAASTEVIRRLLKILLAIETYMEPIEARQKEPRGEVSPS